MKQIFIQLSVVIFLLSAVSFRCLGADKYTLEFNLEKGKTYKRNTVSDVNLTVNAMGQETKMNVKSELCNHYEVTGQNNDVYDIRMTYQKLKTSITGGPITFSIDSDSPENSSDQNSVKDIKSLLGIPIDIQLAKQGKVISVKGIDQLTEKIDAMSNEQAKQMFNQQFSEKMIQTLVEQLSSYFPVKPVAVDESWDVTLNLDNGGFDIISKMNLSLKQVKDNVATIQLTGTLATPEGGAVLQIQGMDAKVSMTGEQSGTILTDMKTGWILRSDVTQKSTQNIEIMGQSIQQQMEMTTTITAE